MNFKEVLLESDKLKSTIDSLRPIDKEIEYRVLQKLRLGDRRIEHPFECFLSRDPDLHAIKAKLESQLKAVKRLIQREEESKTDMTLS